MPQNLDSDTRTIVIRVTSFTTVVIVLFSAYAVIVLLPRLRRRSSKAVARRKTNYDHPSILALGLWCLRTLGWMGLGSALLTYLLILVGGGGERKDNHSYNLPYTSSINFCEPDFEDVAFVAEPTNSVSSIVCYIPLAVLGMTMFGRQARGGQFVCYAALLAVGVGSTALHALLTASAQGGDELPMLWYCAAAANTCGQILLTGYASKTRQAQLAPFVPIGVASTAVIATAVYVLARDNFVFFYIMFSLYAQALVFGLLIICFLLPWRINGGQQSIVDSFRCDILLPLALLTGMTMVVAMWTWVSEMLFCNSVTLDFAFGTTVAPFVWKRCIHPLWHMTSGLLAWLLLQVLHAAQGMQQGWGYPRLVYMYGAPTVVFATDNKRQKNGKQL